MLREIGIRNFVLFENLRLEMGEGLNVLTGETGAGKSIVLDAVGLLLGDRFRSDAVRQGAERAEIDATFDVPRSREFKRWWDEHGFEKATEIVIRREGFPDGRSRAFLNDRPVTLAALTELGSFLVDVHGQNEHQQILKPAVQQDLLDRFAGHDTAVQAIEPLFHDWQRLQTALQAGVLSEHERLQRVDLLTFQSQEIEQAKLQRGEDEELATRLPELKNAEKLRALAEAAYALLYEEEGAALERVGLAEKTFEALKALAPAVEPLLQQLKEARGQLEDAAHQLQSMSERWNVDPAALESALSRQDLISRLSKKYGGTLEAVIAHGEKIRAELDQLENADSHRRDLETKATAARQALEKASLDLSTKRKRAAKELSVAVQKQLGDLGFANAVFRCQVDVREGEDTARFTTTGIDRVMFEWAPNPGEGIQPLKAIASGGEMSRVMLALRTVLADSDAVPSLIFDEIDAGVGGLTAQAVGKKLRDLSQHHQVLCVTHLPQIASCAHAHFHVSKRVAKTRTVAHVVRLEPTERLQELARLLGSQVTPTSVQHAREMLAQNQ